MTAADLPRRHIRRFELQPFDYTVELLLALERHSKSYTVREYD